ncbi:hypothetical protein ABZY44_27690 [Streptomyces sp. NPDC006544]|uniref:hypothetical protein n=1 Tax=Streptomyces sp. NPDC006544 TaxID=3154583 RepID=UPI0033B80703
MDTYAHGYGNTGHYARPGTHTSYCGRELMHEPNTPIAARICKSCAKAEQADRVAAEEVAADRAIEGPTLAERAGVRYCEVGTGRRVHYSNTDDTLCGRQVSEYNDGPTGGQQLCARCIKAAEARAYARSLAAASPLAAAAVEVAEIVEAVDPRAFLRAAVLNEGGEWNVERVTALYEAAGLDVDRNTRWGFLLTLCEAEGLLAPCDQRGTFTAIPAAEPEAPVEAAPADVVRVAARAFRRGGSTITETITTVHTNCACKIGKRTLIGTYSTKADADRVAAETARDTGRVSTFCIQSRPLNTTPTEAVEAIAEEAAAFDTVARAVDAVEHAEEAAAAVDTVEEAEALYAAALVTEADADAGTWRGEWIGEQQAADTLFAVEGPVEQGALFREAEPAEQPDKLIVRARFAPAAVERVKAKAAADRAAWRAEMDARKAAEAARYGAPEQAPARRVVEGVIVRHAGATEGSTPRNAMHPRVIATRAALSGLAVARLTDHHDVSAPTQEEQAVRGYMVEPRGGRRVAVYWLEAGRTIRHDDRWHGASLDCLAHRLTSRGWRVEDMLTSSHCLFAHQPE